MKSNQLLFLVLAIASACTLGFFVWNSSNSTTRSGLGQDEVQTANSETELEAAKLNTLEAAEVDSPTALTPQAQGGTRSSISGAAQTIQIEIGVPQGSALEPGLRVIAVPSEAVGRTNGRSTLDKLLRGDPVDFEWSSAEVRSGWMAELPVPKSIEDPVVLLDGECLFLEEPATLPTDGSTLRLEAQLGSCLIVRLTESGNREVKGSVRLMGFTMNGGRNFSTRTSPASQTTLRGLKSGLTWMAVPDLEEHYSAGKMGLQLAAGEKREIEIPLEQGCRITGTVVDDGNQPLSGIEVKLTNNQPWMRMMGGGTKAKTDEFGVYDLGLVGQGTQTVEASKKGRVDAKSEEVELVDGEIRTNVNLTLSLGKSIQGKVTMPDGTPAPNAKVVSETRRSRGGFGPWGGNRRTEAGRSTTDKEGFFEITGLADGKYTIKAEKRSEGTLGEKLTLHGEVTAVDAGLKAIQLRLAQPLVIAGQVLDDQGDPIQEFSIVGKSTRDGGPTEKQKFTSEDGRFQFERLGAGSWNLTAEAKGYAQEEPIAIELPGLKNQIKLIINRRARISGTVLDSGGNPVIGATVRAGDGAPRRGWGGNRGPRGETDEEGRFEVDDLAPGTWTLTASAKGWADSTAETIEITAGMVLEDVVLGLRRGGRIAGTVSSPEGLPLPGQRVTWGDNPMGFGNRNEVRTDSQGRFLFENVTPGDWQVSATAPMEELGERMQKANGASAFTSMMEDLLTTNCTVEEDETTEVFLGGEPKRPVRIVGKVRQGEEPLAKAQVYAVSEGSAVFQGMKSGISASDGSYELIVDRPGAYIVSARKGSIGVESLVEVPRDDSFQVELVIPSGGLFGFVTEPNGDLASGIRVSLEREDGLGRIRWAGDSSRTGVEGRYAFEGLEPGTYTIRVNTGSMMGGSSNASWATNVLSGIQVGKEGQVQTDFRLQKPGSIKGIVLGSDGKPAEGATVFFRDTDGRQIAAISTTVTDATGRFERKGLAAGPYSLIAKNGQFASVESPAVPVQVGKESEVRLEMASATTLVVTLEDKDKGNQRLRVEVFDSEGREVGGMRTMAAMQVAFREGTSSSERRVGPLPPGAYRVRASTADGRFQEKKLTVSGSQEEKSIKLTLAD